MYHSYVIYAGVKYYFTGANFDSDFKRAKNYVSISKMATALQPLHGHIKRNKLSVYKDKTAIKKNKAAIKKNNSLSKKSLRLKNPTKSVKNKILEATERHKDFSGHTPEFIDKKDLHDFSVSFKVGMCDAILYTTTRDGRVEKYVHEFKKKARPILASSHDGKKITLIGGNYKFTDRGIVDD